MTPERWRQVTEGVVAGTTVAVVLYDIAARWFGGNDATVSVVLSDAARKWPVIALAAGALMGHLFWPVD
jgi:putative effector of murein hydrolase